MKLLIAAVVGLLLAVGSPSQDRKPKPADEDREYAKVELKGRLYAMPPPPDVPLLQVRDDQYQLDLSQQKELQGEALAKLHGEVVLVTGTLSLRPDSRGMARVLVSNLRLVKER